MGKLYHYSASALPIDTSRRYIQGGFPYKPSGLYLSVEDEWARWCEAEGYYPERLAYRSEVVISDPSALLILRDRDDLDILEDMALPQSESARRWSMSFAIDWERVARRYSGIFIPDYGQVMQAVGMSIMWDVISAWDVSSACIWDLSIVKVDPPVRCSNVQDITEMIDKEAV